MKKYSDDERAVIVLDSFVGLTKEQKLRVLQSVSRPADLFGGVSEELFGKNKKINDSTIKALNALLLSGGDRQILSELEKDGTEVLTCISDGFPDKLLEISSPPMILYCKGNIGLLKEKYCFSIVGSRKTLPEVLARTREFSERLSKEGVVLVTGLAEGVDAEVIKGSIGNSSIISVLPCGFKHVYPEYHFRMFEEICKKGLVVSEYNPDVICKPYFFPERNRIIAAIGDGVLVTSAGKKSGTSYTADFANEYGKTVFAFPYNIGVPSGEGCNAMIKEYALLCDDVNDIFFHLGITPAKKTQKQALTDKEAMVFSIIGEREIHMDELIEKTGMKIFELTPVLTMLEIKKYIVKNPGNTFSSVS